ncbi:hypothetical protein UA3_02587 [Enterococcus faecium EnGen0263]|uniref:DUF5592 family protein n=1 Tax=Enterococcus faecium TaxID=1352 RepID=UPI00032E3AC4|nr:DUF5592 family protein [Enterococcus faecium]EME8112440.1 hypothetical protein [Enterococcus faecium]EOH52461.1 hypothetical protein UA3_02587 [Enterococcus faecium EnGen0263]
MPTYDIQDEILTKAKFWGYLIVSDLVYGLVSFQIIARIYEYTAPLFKIPALILLPLLALYWILPSPGNKGKRNYHRLWMIIIKNRQTYHSLPFIEIEDEVELADFLVSDDELKQMYQEEDLYTIENEIY